MFRELRQAVVERRGRCMTSAVSVEGTGHPARTDKFKTEAIGHRGQRVQSSRGDKCGHRALCRVV